MAAVQGSADKKNSNNFFIDDLALKMLYINDTVYQLKLITVFN